jgi:LPXTG-motif cell wall-anchored protein
VIEKDREATQDRFSQIMIGAGIVMVLLLLALIIVLIRRRKRNQA